MVRDDQPPSRSETYELRLLAEYSQVLVADDGPTGDLADAWTQEAVARHLAVADGIVAIGTARNGPVPVRVTVSQDPPPVHVDADSVVEADLRCDSGRLVVTNCTDSDGLRISVPPGSYRVRATASGWPTVHGEWLEGDDDYRIDLWPASPVGVAVVKPCAL